MGKPKAAEKKSTQVRLPKPLYDRLLRISTERSIKTGRSVSVNSLIVEAVQQSLAAA